MKLPVQILTQLNQALETREFEWINTKRVSDDWKQRIYEHKKSALQVSLMDKKKINFRLEKELKPTRGVKRLPTCPKGSTLDISESHFKRNRGHCYEAESPNAFLDMVDQYVYGYKPGNLSNSESPPLSDLKAGPSDDLDEQEGALGSVENDETDEKQLEQLRALAAISDLDEDAKGSRRKEQHALRKYLTAGRNVGRCIVCNNTFPVDLLVASHLKRRSDCTTQERLDFKGVAGLMCRFGCDDLYEKGYIGVTEGKVTVIRDLISTTEPVAKYLASVNGNTVESWQRSKPYFSWHFDRHRNN